MDISRFVARLVTARPRAAALTTGAADGPALRELEEAWEELSVAEEELRQQGDELLSAQQGLELEHRRYRDLFDAAPDPYVITDLAGMVREVNRTALELFGVSERAVVGKPLVVFVAPQDRRSFRSMLIKLPQLRKLADWDVLVQPRQSGARAASVTVSLVSRPDGLPGELRWLIRDVSERRRYQDELRGWAEELENRVRQRTVELEHQAQELERQTVELERQAAREKEMRLRAEEADRAKEVFLATVSHELRTPLSALLGWVYVLTHGTMEGERREKTYEAIERSTRAQIKLVDDILDASRMAAGKLHMEKTTVDLTDVVSAAVSTLQPTAAQRQVAVECVLCDGAAPVVADPDRLQQVFWNLLSNAIKFTPAGGRVEVRSEITRGEAAVTVTDSGAGIEPDFLPHVFERFRQADTSTTRPQGGLGLGLAIARYIVEAHGGTISAASEGKGRGATFRVSIPLPDTSSSDVGTLSTATTSVPAPDRLRVLVVEDDEATR